MARSKYRTRNVIDNLANLRIYLSNGQGYFSILKYPIVLATGIKIYLPNFNLFSVALIVLVGFVGLIILGWFDYKYIKLAQRTNEISTEKYNPYFSKLKKDLNSKAITIN